MFERDHVIYLMRKTGLILMKQAVFAASARAPNDKATKLGWDSDTGHKQVKKTVIEKLVVPPTARAL